MIGQAVVVADDHPPFREVPEAAVAARVAAIMGRLGAARCPPS